MLDLSSTPRIKKTKHWFTEINQLYHPTGTFSQDSQDIVYSFNNINETKFIPILLKEWFYLVKSGGFLVIDYQPNETCNVRQLEKNMWWLWKGAYEIVYHGPVEKRCLLNLDENKLKNYISKKITHYHNNLDPQTKLPSVSLPEMLNNPAHNFLRFICKKVVGIKMTGDSINRWTIGIVTRGLRNEWMERLISSIHDQKIPEYEILVCGTYFDKKEPHFHYIPFNQRDDKGWISRKKNLIVRNARYENILILHDRLFLDKNWYKGMRQWGNCFEHLSCCQLFGNERINDWFARHFEIDKDNQSYFAYGSNVDYRDWYSSIVIMGQLNIFKKSIVLNNNLFWDECLYYGEGEDLCFSKNLFLNGYIHRLNNLSIVRSQTFKELAPTCIKYNPTLTKIKIVFDTPYSFYKLLSYLFVRLLTLFHIYLPTALIYGFRNKLYALLLFMSPSKYSHYLEWKKTTLGKR